MEIGPVKNSRPLQPSAEDGPKASEVREKGKVSQDRLEVSESARLKLAELAEAAVHKTEKEAEQAGIRKGDSKPARTEKPPTSVAGTAAHDRIEEIRRRMQDGFYDRPEILEEIADRLSGDLED